MLKTKIAVTKWIKNNFINGENLAKFIEFTNLHEFILEGRTLKPEYMEVYEVGKEKYLSVFNSIKDLPEIEIVERFGNETHKTMRTPLNYMWYMYANDAKKRNKLFKVA